MSRAKVNDPEGVVDRRRDMDKYWNNPITLELLALVDEVRQKLFNDIMIKDNIPGNNNDERMNYVNLVKGHIRGISQFEAVLRGEIEDADTLYKQIRASIEQGQTSPDVGTDDYNRGGYPPANI